MPYIMPTSYENTIKSIKTISRQDAKTPGEITQPLPGFPFAYFAPLRAMPFRLKIKTISRKGAKKIYSGM